MAKIYVFIVAQTYIFLLLMKENEALGDYMN
jgi:hypothetical protein